MPLPERLIQPVSVSRGTLQFPVPDELEGVTNGTLANVIRQLSSLSRHAEEMFGNLFSEAESMARRSAGLQARIDRLAVQVTSLDSTVEEVSLQDIHLKKAFRSSRPFDQQVVSRETMPKAMMEAYLACDRPPPLDKLNPYREDGKDGLKFYTDPTYFFELWRQEMLKDTERVMNDRGKKPGKSAGSNGQKAERNKKRLRQPHNTNEKHRQKAVGQGEYILEADGAAAAGGSEGVQRPSGIIGYDPALAPLPSDLHGMNRNRPNSIELKRPGFNQQQQQMPPPQQQQLLQQQQHAQQQMQQQQPPGGYQYNPNQEPIYTPRILRNEQPPSPQRQQPPHQMPPMMQQQYQPYTLQQQQAPQQQQSYMMQQQQQQQPPQAMSLPAFNSDQPQATGDHPGSNVGTPTRRPNEPPPAPPSAEGTPTRQNNRDSLPPPPPPPPVSEMQAVSISQPMPPPQQANGPTTSYTMQQQQKQQPPPHSSPMHQQLMSQLNSHHQEQQQASDLPPPPPVPVTTAASDFLSAQVPASHLPPSPPPPPLDATPVTTTASAAAVTSAAVSAAAAAAASTNGMPEVQKSFSPPKAVNNGGDMATGGGVVPPPPPPPPPANGGLKNGDINSGGASPFAKANGSPPKSILSPQGIKKQSVVHHKHSVQEGIRSDLLKAIRDGIALRKVEERKAAQQAKENDDKAAAASASSGGGGSGSSSSQGGSGSGGGGNQGQSDVASILARRVAVEMSDSEGGDADNASDSEYDSDDWGDESQA